MRAPAIIDFAETEYGNIDSDPTHENIHAISKQKTFESLSTLLATGVQPEDTDGVSDSFLETDSTLKTKIVSDSSEVDIKNKISSCLEERTAVTDTGSVDLILIKEDPFLITFENVCTSATSTTCPKVTPKLYSPTCATIDAISLEEIGSLPRNSEDALGKISPEHKSDSLTSESISKAACPPPLLEHIAYDMEAIEPVKMILGLSFAAQQSKQAEKTPSGQLNHHYLTDVSEHPTERDDQAITKSSRLDFEEPPKYVETGKQVQIKSHDLTVLLKKADEIVDAVLHLAIEEIRSKQTAGVCQTNDIKDNLLETSLQKDQNIIKKLSESKEIQSKNSSLKAEKSILPFEGNDQSNKMLESTSSESFLTVEAKRFRVYPFSLSPIYEDDSSQEDLLSTDISPGDNLNEKSRNNPSLSVLSLLQSVSERLKSSDQCQEEEEEAYISSHWTGHSSSIVPEDIYEKGSFSKHSSFLSMEAFSTKEALSFSTSCSAQLLQDFDHGMKSSSKSIYYEALQSKSSYEGEKGTQLGSILLSRDPQPENCDLQRQMIICDVHGKTNKYEIYHDVIDLTGWVFSKEVLIRVIRGCWVLYEKPGFQGQKYYLEEGEMMLNDILNQQTEKHKGSFTIGSIRQIMKNCSVPEIQLYPEGHSEYFPISIQSAIADVEELEIKNLTLSVKAGVWFAYSDVNYKGEVMVLEENCPCEISTADIKSLYPLKMVRIIILYERPHFGGWCKELSENIDCIPILFENVGDFQGIGSIRVIGGIWVAYEKERYKGQQYLLEEGEYEDWTSWGGMNSTLLSFRFLQANFMESAITLFETDEEDGKLLDIVNEEIPDLEVAGYGLVTRSINVKSGVWVAYQQKYFCGEQYVLEKGKYKCFFDWGGSNETIMSIRPVNLEPLGSHEPKHRLKAFSNTHFQGTCMDITTEVAEFASFSPCSFKVLRGCWLLHYQGSSDNDQCVLEEDLYTDLASCGCPAAAVKSLKPIEYVFAESFISLFALENCEGREWHLQEAVGSVVNKDLHFLTQSVWVKSGLWIAYEGCNFVGKQFLLTAGKISNWTQFSGWKVIGSLRPVKQPAVYFRIKNKSQDRYLTVAGNLMDARASSVCLSPLNGKNTQIWCYSCGLIKSKVNDACLDVIGGRDTPGAKVALWAEHGKARQKWTYNKDGTISSYLNDQLVLDIKGGCYYDRNHIVVNQVNGGECTQKWDIEIL
uniref:Crystallin beta-gamma domain containing 3 n=1 Tax=Anolis carolinensis TaxID=28377 RepID=A0A803T3V8_ANOCA